MEEELVDEVDRIVSNAVPVRRGSRRRGRPNRSAFIRLAVRDFVARHHQKGREQREARILAEHRVKLTRELAALVAEQARP